MKIETEKLLFALHVIYLLTKIKVILNIIKAREKEELRVSHQFRAELLFEPLFVSRKDRGIFETSNSLGGEDIETVLHGEHQQRPRERVEVNLSPEQIFIMIKSPNKKTNFRAWISSDDASEAMFSETGSFFFSIYKHVT